jgi:flagellar protein FliS
MSTAPYSAYKVTATTTADPVTLTTMLFDGGIKAIKKARLHSESGNRQAFLKEVERAYLIVGELLATLDLTQGELPKTLSGIYAYCMRCITESTLGDMSKLDEAEKHIARIGAAWKLATASLRPNALEQRSTTAAA